MSDKIIIPNTDFFIGCPIKLKSNHNSTGVIVGKSQRSRKGKPFCKVEWGDDENTITNVLCDHLDTL